jgi:hypothetical protein
MIIVHEYAQLGISMRLAEALSSAESVVCRTSSSIAARVCLSWRASAL